MDREELLKLARRLGVSFLEKEDFVGSNIVLYEAMKSDEKRLWESFPVLLANAVERADFDYAEITRLLKNKREKDRFLRLILLSLSAYDHFNLKYSWIDRLRARLAKSEKKKMNEIFKKFKQDQDIIISDFHLSPPRIKRFFEIYFSERDEKTERTMKKYEEMSLEYALSQIFPPKQKELFLKKVRGEKMNRTEIEYYSRTVKKKVVALSNSELHNLARKSLEA